MALTDLDRQLLERCLSEGPGESGSAWADFVERFLGLFLHVIRHTADTRSATLRADQEEDLVGDILLEILSDDRAVLRQFRGEASLATYLTVVSRRTVVRRMASMRRSEAMGHVKAQGVSDGAIDTLSDASIEVASRDEVATLLAELPADEAEIVRRHHLEGQTYEQISAEVGLPVNSIGPILSKARKRMGRGAASA
ncbi:MAG: sigma-70 family RNA polymerase sigma factor [Planctomycetota bacterium]